MKNILARFVADESGSTVIEYGLLALLISIGIIGAVTMIGTTLGGIYVAIGNALIGAG
jgi:pilus assembly protein Flp/PilA